MLVYLEYPRGSEGNLLEKYEISEAENHSSSKISSFPLDTEPARK